MKKIIILLVLFFGLSIQIVFSQSQISKDIQVLCNRISEIKQLPRYSESGVDTAYDAIFQSGEAVVPCLIENITNTTIMTDPRCPHISNKTRVGDVAYFLLVDITKIGFTDLLPINVQKKYKTEGIYAYHNYIENKGKRKQLKIKFREWYQMNQISKK